MLLYVQTKQQPRGVTDIPELQNKNTQEKELAYSTGPSKWLERLMIERERERER